MASLGFRTIATVQAKPSNSGTSFNLVLGTVHFSDLEHPENLPLPSAQQIAVHQQAGGTRTIQTFGAQPGPISWKGTFFFYGAVDRMREMQRMQVAGKPVYLTWGPLKWEVIVSKFEPTVHHQYEIAYEVTCEVIRDLTGQSTLASVTSLDSVNQSLFDQIQMRYAQLQALDPTTNVWGTTLASAGSALSVAAPLSNASPSALSQAISSVQNAINTVSPYVDALAPLVGASNLQQFFTAQGILSNLQVIASNLGSGFSAKSVQVIGGSLFGIAAKFYGDPSLWTVLATANNLTSVYLSNQKATTLKIPSQPVTPPQASTNNAILPNASSIVA